MRALFHSPSYYTNTRLRLQNKTRPLLGPRTATSRPCIRPYLSPWQSHGPDPQEAAQSYET